MVPDFVTIPLFILKYKKKVVGSSPTVSSKKVSTVRAHYPLIDLSRLEGGYPKEVGPEEADDL